MVLVLFAYQAIAIEDFGSRALPEPADVIIVLGPRLSGERLDALGAARAAAAARCWHDGRAPVILATGGTVSPGTIPEGEALRRELVGLGVQGESILVEVGSHSTLENLRAAHAIMRTRGWQRALVVSNRFHLRRASKLAERIGMVATVTGEDPQDPSWSLYAWWLPREVAASLYYGIW